MYYLLLKIRGKKILIFVNVYAHIVGDVIVEPISL